MTRPTPGELLGLARPLAERTGSELLRRRRVAAPDVSTKSTTTDLVTPLDRWAETTIVGGLLDARPDDGIVAEEGGSRRGTSGVDWYVDPIDGTTNFVYGHPGWCVSVAAAVDGVLVAGVVVDPERGESFTAIRGGGAWCNDEPIGASRREDLATALVATGFAYAPERRLAQARLLESLLPEVRDIRRMGSAALDLCSVACGRVDAYFEAWLNPWDVAAGELLAVEAGAVVTGLDGGPARAGAVLAAPPVLYAALRSLLDRAGT